ncbi:unnamed protein product, partial [Brassica rapa subsp. narinosa]
MNQEIAIDTLHGHRMGYVFLIVSISSLSSFICLIIELVMFYVWLLSLWVRVWSFYIVFLLNKNASLVWLCWHHLLLQGASVR